MLTACSRASTRWRRHGCRDSARGRRCKARSRADLIGDNAQQPQVVAPRPWSTNALTPLELIVGSALCVCFVLALALALLLYLEATSLTAPFAIVIAALLVSAALLAKMPG